MFIKPYQPDAPPRCSGGTTSGINAEYGAVATLFQNSTHMNAKIYRGSEDKSFARGKNASPPSPTMFINVPSTIHGRRRPKRVKRRSLNAPKNGATTMDTNAPMSSTTPSVEPLTASPPIKFACAGRVVMRMTVQWTLLPNQNSDSIAWLNVDRRGRVEIAGAMVLMRF